MAARNENERTSVHEREIIITEEWMQRVLQESGVVLTREELVSVANEAFGFWGGGDPVSVGLKLRLMQACEAIQGVDLEDKQRELLERQRDVFERYC